MFNNIMLPDSGSSEIESHGYLKYRVYIKPNLPTGTRISNMAEIYFDQNPPIITNTKINTLYKCGSLIMSGLSSNIMCYGDSIKLNLIGNLPGSIYNWNISNVFNSSASFFVWEADTFGLHTLTISVDNPMCHKDSLLNLIINNNYFNSTNYSICQGDSMLIYGNYQSTAGVYYDSLQTTLGCDSILSTTLSITPKFNINLNQSICQGDSLLIYGTYQSTVGVYYDSLQTIVGCDSILSTTLTVNPQPNVAITPFNPDSLCQFDLPYLLTNGSPSGGIYSGFGVTSNNFNPALVPGAYYISYTYTDSNSCASQDSTVIKLYICVGIDEFGNDLGILIYPNPNTGEFTIEKPFYLNKEVKVKVLDATSKLIIDKIIPAGKQKIEIDITKNSNGIYYLQLIIEDKVFVKQILKQ